MSEHPFLSMLADGLIRSDDLKTKRVQMILNNGAMVEQLRHCPRHVDRRIKSASMLKTNNINNIVKMVNDSSFSSRGGT